jgi:hypothetical protein
MRKPAPLTELSLVKRTCRIVCGDTMATLEPDALAMRFIVRVREMDEPGVTCRIELRPQKRAIVVDDDVVVIT